MLVEILGGGAQTIDAPTQSWKSKRLELETLF